MASTPNQLMDQTTRHAVYIERYKTSAVREYDAVLKRLEKEIRVRLLGDNVTDWNRMRLEMQLTSIKSAMAELSKGVTDLLRSQILEIAGYESEFEIKSLNQVMPRNYHVPSNTQLNSAVFSQPMQVSGPYGGALLETFISDLPDRMVTRIDGAIRMGFAQGRTTQQIVSDIIGAGGTMDLTRRDVTSVVRTGIAHSASVAREQTWQANADIIKGVKIVATLDNRTTKLCRSLDGQVFPLSKGPRPPFHVNCRTTTVAALDDRFSGIDKGGTRSARGEDGKVVSVPANQTYYGWLKKQPAAFQDDVIGPARGKLLRNGGLGQERFAELQLGKRFEPLTIPEMRKLEPLAFERANL